MSIRIGTKVELPTGKIGYVDSIELDFKVALVKTQDDALVKVLIDDLVIVEDTEKTINRDDFRKVSIAFNNS